MPDITLKIRYRPNSRLYVFNLHIEEKNLPIEVLAWKFAELTTENYIDYLGGKKDKRFERRYRLGQYKMILNYLEAKI